MEISFLNIKFPLTPYLPVAKELDDKKLQGDEDEAEAEVEGPDGEEGAGAAQGVHQVSSEEPCRGQAWGRRRRIKEHLKSSYLSYVYLSIHPSVYPSTYLLIYL